MTYRAKLLKSGNAQAVRLPVTIRFEGDEALIHREGDKAILEPVQKRLGLKVFGTCLLKTWRFKRQSPCRPSP